MLFYGKLLSPSLKTTKGVKPCLKKYGREMAELLSLTPNV